MIKYTYRYSLEKHRSGKQKHICSQCGKKSFVRYINNSTNQYVADHVGKCDRLEKCNYHLHPYDYKKDNPKNYRIIPKNKNMRNNTNVIDSISFDYAEKFSKRKENNLNDFLYRIFRKDKVNEINDMYFVGSTKDKMTIFPLIDANRTLRSAKFMQYNPDTGKRLKDAAYAFDWLHSVLIRKKYLPENFVLKTCLFGEHLIRLDKNKGKTICIVESEKTAIIASICISECLFMATGSRENLTIDRLKPLKEWRIRLYPDTTEDSSTFEKWKNRADEAHLLGFNISISDFFERNCTDEQKQKGYDLADYLIDKILSSKNGNQIQTNDPVLLDMISRNPAFEYLINTFQLELTQIHPINK